MSKCNSRTVDNSWNTQNKLEFCLLNGYVWRLQRFLRQQCKEDLVIVDLHLMCITQKDEHVLKHVVLVTILKAISASTATRHVNRSFLHKPHLSNYNYLILWVRHKSNWAFHLSTALASPLFTKHPQVNWKVDGDMYSFYSYCCCSGWLWTRDWPSTPEWCELLWNRVLSSELQANRNSHLFTLLWCWSCLFFM